MDSFKIIVADLQTRKGYDVFSICKNNDFSIIGASSDKSFERFILSIIYFQKVVKLNSKSFETDLNLLLKNHSEKIVFFPTNEKLILSFYDFLENNQPNNIYYSLPDRKMFETVLDKRIFSKFCIENGFPVPIEYQYEQLILNKEIPSNLIIKPKIGAGSKGIRFIDSMEELLNCKDISFSDYIIQERLTNSRDVKGAFFLFDKGKCISYYGHKRLRTYPERGGITIYSKCETNDQLEKLGVDLLEKLNWSGLAMVEFIFDEKSNSYKIIEVNPRVWGSVLLSEKSGSKMIENYVRLALNKEIVKPKLDVNTFIRWFFPWDLISYIRNKGKIKDFWKFNRKKTCYITFTYASWYRSILFLLYNLFNPKKLIILVEKLFK